MVIRKVVNGVKWTAETIRGAAVVLASPNAPIPPSQLHPRMMARPWLPGEWLRMNSTRFLWQYIPIFRFVVFSTLGTLFVIKFLLPQKPRQRFINAENAAAEHKHEKDSFYGVRQRRQDKIYFEKYDPLRAHRPEAYGLVYGGGH